jgi:hypothetical protein
MNNISILLLFNIIIIYLSYNFKKNIIIYPFIFIFLITLYLHLIYNKYINVVEGNSFFGIDSSIYSLWDELDKDPLKEDKLLSEKYSIFNKVNKMFKSIINRENKSL